MARQVERRERTRAQLIEAAAGCFEAMGYAETSLNAVLQVAGVSKGALYHHFGSKTDLLEAVFADVSRQVLGRAAAASAGTVTAHQALSAALKAWLRAALEPRAGRILLEIGPGVLGFAKARDIELALSEGAMHALIERARTMGEADCADVTLTARLLNAAITEMALTALDRGHRAADLARFDDAIDTLIAALLPRPTQQLQIT